MTIGLASTALSQSPGTATIVGHVLNETSGQFLQRAKISVQGTSLETFTDDLGMYRLTNIPAGTFTLTASFTGLDQSSTTVTLAPGGTARRDFTLTRTQPAEGADPVMLDQFVVAANREINARAIAINEQRFAENIKNVVSTDEFGDIGENNIGEFVKFIPGVSVNYSGGVMATDLSVRGFPPATTLVNMDGAEVATTGVVNPNRQLDLNAFPSLNNIARVEVLKTPTPDKPASMMGGSVNLITRSAFELAKPRFSYRAAGTWNSKTSGLRHPVKRDKKMNVIGPSLDFNYVAPVNQRWGYSLSGAYFSRLNVHDMVMHVWDLINPRLLNAQLPSSPQIRASASGGATVDYKIGENSVISGTLNYAEGDVWADQYNMTAAVGNAATGGPTFSQSTGTQGSGTTNSSLTAIHDQTWHGALKFRHTGSVWRWDGNTYFSSATNKRRALDRGTLTGVTGQLTALSVRLDDISHKGPGSITARNAAGAVVDIRDARLYRLVSAQDFNRNSWSTKSGFQLNGARRFATEVPFDLKAGTYYNRERRDNRNQTWSYTFLGPDGIANNADNVVGLYDFVATGQSSLKGAYGTPQATYISHYKVTDYFRANPNQFAFNEAAYIQNRAQNSSRIAEVISAAYVRADARVMSNRLWLVGGVRFERTEDDGVGLLNDVRATLQQDANGNLIRDSAGRAIPVTTDPVERNRLQFKERGAHNRRSYSNYYPSFNAAFNLTENMVARAAYARTIGRPNFINIIPGITVTDPDVARPTITVNNTGLKPWTADGYDLSLEWYFGTTSMASIGVYRRDVRDFFGALSLAATPDLLREHGLTDDYLNYEIITRTNAGDARMSGVEFAYRHALTFLPNWARGIQVFANGTFLDLKGSSLADFTGYAERDLSWGITLNRVRYMAKLNWSANGGIKGNALGTSATIPAGTHFYTPSRTTLDANFEIRLHPKWAIFGTARNLLDSEVRRLRVGPGVPDFAQAERYNKPGVFGTLGVKGTF